MYVARERHTEGDRERQADMSSAAAGTPWRCGLWLMWRDHWTKRAPWRSWGPSWRTSRGRTSRGQDGSREMPTHSNQEWCTLCWKCTGRGPSVLPIREGKTFRREPAFCLRESPLDFLVVLIRAEESFAMSLALLGHAVGKCWLCVPFWPPGELCRCAWFWAGSRSRMFWSAGRKAVARSEQSTCSAAPCSGNPSGWHARHPLEGCKCDFHAAACLSSFLPCRMVHHHHHRHQHLSSSSLINIIVSIIVLRWARAVPWRTWRPGSLLSCNHVWNTHIAAFKLWFNDGHGPRTSWIVAVVKKTVLRRRVAGAVGTWQRKCCGKMVNRWSRPRNKRGGITRTGPMYAWWYRTAPMGAAAPIVMANMVARWIGEANSFFWAAPVSRLLERLTDVPLKLKKRNNVREIDVGLKWMFSLASCGFIRKRWPSLPGSTVHSWYHVWIVQFPPTTPSCTHLHLSRISTSILGSVTPSLRVTLYWIILKVNYIRS